MAMFVEDRDLAERDIRKIVGECVSSEYRSYILDYPFKDTNKSIMDMIIEDIEESSRYQFEGDYTDEDIRLAIGRVFMKQMNIDI